MSHGVTRWETREARQRFSSRTGLSVADVRVFLADVDAAGISDDTRVRVEDKLAGEGGNRTGHIEAAQRIELPPEGDEPS